MAHPFASAPRPFLAGLFPTPPHGPKRLHPVEDYFDDLSMHLMWEIYKRDFQLFKYDFDNPGNKMPKSEVDLDEVHAKLGD